MSLSPTGTDESDHILEQQVQKLKRVEEANLRRTGGDRDKFTIVK